MKAGKEERNCFGGSELKRGEKVLGLGVENLGNEQRREALEVWLDHGPVVSH